jgi:hypothetical protein
MMRSFSSRPDTAVVDEPFYAHYLLQTGISHPGREQVISSCETDWRKVLAAITGPIPQGKGVWYQKHMAHHMLPHMDAQAMIESDAMIHAFLIREPAEVISSYTKVHPSMTLAETGLPYQVDLFSRANRVTGKTPPVIDSRDLLADPRRTLGRLCEAVGIGFDDRMLSWATGPHPSDGCWAPHWYSSVYESTGFEPYQAKPVTVREDLQPMLKAANALFAELHQHRL